MAGNSAAEKAARIAKIKADRDRVLGPRRAAEAKAEAANPNSAANRAARTAKIKADRDRVLGPRRAAEARAAAQRAAQRAAERTSNFNKAKANASSPGSNYTPSAPRQKSAAEKAAEAARAKERANNFEKAHQNAGGTPTPTTPPSSIAKTAKKWSMDSEAIKSIARRQRAKQGQYKGKYYGPDAFKGNITKIEEWKKKGKPPIASFLKK